jgi:hypothetical protein
MDRLRPRRFRGRDNFVGVEITVRRSGVSKRHGFIRLLNVKRVRVDVRVDGDRFDAEASQGADNPTGDRAAIGDENFGERHGSREGSGGREGSEEG